jgi:hypothetical protein
MAGTKIIKVELDTETAEFTVDLTGFQGQGCGDIIKAFSAIGDISKEIHKPEFKTVTKNAQVAGR